MNNLPEALFGKDGSLHEAQLKIYSKTGSIFTVKSKLAQAKGEMIALPDTITAESMIVQFQKINTDNSIELGVKESDALLDFVTLKAYKFPFINLLWFGILTCAMGILMSMVRRIQQNRNSPSQPI
jgi:cytochrome c-type biogenesis protein CcmF